MIIKRWPCRVQHPYTARSRSPAGVLGRYRSLRLLQFAAALLRALTLNRQWHDQTEMSDIGLTVPGMTEPPRRYDVTITVDQITIPLLRFTRRSQVSIEVSWRAPRLIQEDS